MSPHDLLRPLSEYRATNNLTTRQLWRMWRPELRAIVVHMFLFPPSPLLFDGFICNFSPPSAGPSPVLVPAWAYPDGWVNNVHFCIQVMATIRHTLYTATYKKVTFPKYLHHCHQCNGCRCMCLYIVSVSTIAAWAGLGRIPAPRNICCRCWRWPDF